ncbi:alpha/beta hydrolase [Mycobacterium neumannii]|uniref:alpha/beta hydrolase n=1 Tax=Mycobacterium neumannii TaxID=2048551 RepID=UPI003AB80DB9
MTVSVADIDRWDAGDVREVFNAARGRAEATFEARDGIATLPAFGSWGGDAAEAAKNANEQLRKDLDAHGNEALAVARAADQAAGAVESVKSRLANLRAEASRLGMEIDPVTSTVVPGPNAGGNPMEILLKTEQLQAELASIMAEAQQVDDELARAINMATGAEPIPHDAGPPVGPAGLTPTQIASDVNERRLNQERVSTQATVDELQSRYDQLAAQAYTTGDHSPATMSALENLGKELTDAKSYLGDLNAVHDALGKAPETYLTMFDPRTGTGKPVLAAVAVGNPDTAKNVSVSVPGVGTTPGSLPDMVTEASNLRDTAQRQLDRVGTPGSVAAIAWLGYDAPPNPIDTKSPADLWTTMTDDQAHAGAAGLSSYLQEVRANNPDAHVTLLGHSYGSLTSSLALQDLHAQGVHPVNDVVFYGSPGLGLTNPEQLGLGADNAYVMRAPDDPITTFVAPTAPLHGWGADPYAGMLPELSSQAGFDAGDAFREGVQSHADYPRADNDGNLRMSGYNLAAVVAGLPDNELVFAPPPPAVPLIPQGGQIPLPRAIPGG